MDRQHLLDWFEHDELELCERCGEHAGLHLEKEGPFICFACGYIRWAGGETFVDELQGRAAGETTDGAPIVELLHRHGSLTYAQVAAHLDQPPDVIRRALASLRDRGLVESFSTAETEAHHAKVAVSWRLTDAGREERA
jgi:hypothetical protein